MTRTPRTSMFDPMTDEDPAPDFMPDRISTHLARPKEGSKYYSTRPENAVLM
jgi:hypothetical protein